MSFIRENINPRASDDAALVTAYKESGDLSILADLYQRYMDLVYAVCFKYFKDADLSKDAVMDIFETLSKKLLHHEVNHFRGWLYMVAKNYCLMQLRSRSKQSSIALDDIRMQFAEEVHQEDGKEWQRSS